MLGFTCDVCGREVQGITFVNGMKFCAKCYQETFGNQNANFQIYLPTNEDVLKENAQLKKEIKVLYKALELACERIKNMYEQEQQYCTNEIPDFVEVEKNFFIEQAKEKLNADKTRK